MTEIKTRFEYFESGQGLAGARLGIVPIDLLTRYDFYKTYLEFISEGHNRGESIILASDKCRCHRSTIWRAVYWFEGVYTESIKTREKKRLIAINRHLQMHAQ